MAGLPLLRRKDRSAAEPLADEAASVQAARVRARRRLIGAAVLVGVGIIGFPLLFETQPRPIAVDIPIEIPARENAPPQAMPVTPAAAPATTDAPPPQPMEAPRSTAVAPSAAVAPASAAPAVVKATPAPPPAPARAAADARSEEARRAQALLDGKPVADAGSTKPSERAADAPRFIVQAGAYSDAGSLRTARDKVEKLGLKTYVQTVDTEAGKRTRLRVGPFESRDEAEKAAARIKASGLAVNVLSL